MICNKLLAFCNHQDLVEHCRLRKSICQQSVHVSHMMCSILCCGHMFFQYRIRVSLFKHSANVHKAKASKAGAPVMAKTVLKSPVACNQPIRNDKSPFMIHNPLNKWKFIGPNCRNDCRKEDVRMIVRIKFEEDMPIVDGVFTCHIEFKSYKRSGRKSVRRIRVLKQITSDDHTDPWGSADWKPGAEMPEGEMQREEKRIVLPPGRHE